jgi:hypothetical protein
MWSTGIDRIDASGRVADRAITAALGWRGGDRLTLTAEAGVVVVCRDPAGMVTLSASQYIVIPATLRREGFAAGGREGHICVAVTRDARCDRIEPGRQRVPGRATPQGANGCPRERSPRRTCRCHPSERY